MNPSFHLFAFINTLSSFHLGYSLMYLGSCITQVVGDFGILPEEEDQQIGRLMSSVPTGAMIGSLLSGVIMKRFTRRQASTYMDIMNVFATLMTFTTNYQVFYLARLIQGVYTGLSSVLTFKYLLECVRGQDMNAGATYVSMQVQSSFTVGMALIVFMPKYYDPNSNLHYFVYSILLINSVARLLYGLFVFPYETPRQYIKMGKNDKAFEALLNIYSDESIAKQALEQFKSDQNAKSGTQSTTGQFISGMLLMNLLHLTGNSAISFYSDSIFAQIITDVAFRRYLTLIFGLVGPIANMFTPGLIGRYGNKGTIVYGGSFLTVQLLFLSLLSTQQPDLSTTEGSIIAFAVISSIIAFNFVYSSTMSPCTWNICGTILSDSHMSLVSFSNWVSTAAVSLYFPPLLTSYGLTKSFIAFSGGSAATALFAQFFIATDKKVKDQ